MKVFVPVGSNDLLLACAGHCLIPNRFWLYPKFSVNRRIPRPIVYEIVDDLLVVISGPPRQALGALDREERKREFLLTVPLIPS